MHKLAVDAGVPFDVIDPEDSSFSLPDELITVARNLAAHVWHGGPLLMTPESRALLKQRYIHHSDHYLLLGPLCPFKPGEHSRRTVHPNKGQWIEVGRYEAKPYDHRKEGEDYTRRTESYHEREGEFLEKNGI